ncbi:UTRA domain-containing protein [Bacillus pacificus]
MESFKAIAAEKSMQHGYKLKKNEPSLSLERIAYAKENIIEYTQTIARGDKFIIQLNYNKYSYTYCNSTGQ